MLKLKRLKIEKYRSVKPGTELHFRDSLNVLLGRNGTGKTTLLNLIVQLLGWDFSFLQDEAIDLEYVLLTAQGELLLRVRSDLVQEPSSPMAGSLQSDMEMTGLALLPEIPRYSMSLEIEAVEDGEKRGSLRVEGLSLTLRDGSDSILEQADTQYMLIGKSTHTHIVRRLAFLGFKPSVIARDWLRRLNLSCADSLLRFDESLGYLDYVAREMVFSAQRFSGKAAPYAYLVTSNGAMVSDLLESIIQGLNSNSEADGLELESGRNGASFLDRLVELLGCHSAKIRLQRTSRTSGAQGTVVFGDIRFEVVRRDGSLVNHTFLSYGQKRLIAFYFYLAASPEIVVADELVNGMHHEWIDACLEDLEARQSFLTSQNPLLLDYLDFESAEQVRDSFVLCRAELHEGREQWVWENMDIAQAEGFFKAYQVAIQHVSELLRTRGLW